MSVKIIITMNIPSI